MSVSEHRYAMIRVIIYLVALALVLLLLLNRHVLLPDYGLRIIQVRETRQLGSIVAGEGETLLAVKVRLDVSADIRERLRPGFFALVDAGGQEHRPDSLSSLFSHTLPWDQDRVIEGTLVFHLPEQMKGRSLSFHPEVEDVATDFKSEDLSSKSRP